jgi:hypothetical protein
MSSQPSIRLLADQLRTGGLYEEGDTGYLATRDVGDAKRAVTTLLALASVLTPEEKEFLANRMIDIMTDTSRKAWSKDRASEVLVAVRGGGAEAARVTSPTSVSSTADSQLQQEAQVEPPETARIRRLLLEAASGWAYRTDSSPGESPFSLIEERGEWAAIRRLLDGLATVQVEFLANVRRWPDPDKRMFVERGLPASDQQIDTMLTYYKMLRTMADVGESQALTQAAFFYEAIMVYPSQLESLAGDEDWATYLELAGAYLDDARGVGAPFYLLLPLGAMARGRLGMGDFVGCRALLDEFDAAARTAERQLPAFVPFLSQETYVKWIEDSRQAANHLRAMV